MIRELESSYCASQRRLATERNHSFVKSAPAFLFFLFNLQELPYEHHIGIYTHTFLHASHPVEIARFNGAFQMTSVDVSRYEWSIENRLLSTCFTTRLELHG